MRFSKMTVDEGLSSGRREEVDTQAVHEAARVVVDDAWVPTDVLWSEAETDPTAKARFAVQQYGLGWAPIRAVDIYEGYDPREPFID